SALTGEDECQLSQLARAPDIPWPVGREGVQKLACWLAQRYEMGNPVLGSRGWYRPGRQVFREFRPRHPRHFLAAVAGEHLATGRWRQRGGGLRPPLARLHRLLRRSARVRAW